MNNNPNINLDNVVHCTELVQKKAKSGNLYYVLRTTFKDGYQVENFVSQDQLYIIKKITSTK